MKNILITGAKSYIGESVRDYLLQWPDGYIVTVKDTIGWNPEPNDFMGVDVVFNVAGIAHVKETAKNRHLYYDVNRDLVVKIAKAAKEGGVGQFIVLSTMSVYGLAVGHITKETLPNPKNAYGKSKVQADDAIEELQSDHFVFVCLRPPMVYGKGCKGNYQRLRRIALNSPVFPNYENERSMIYIGNLCEFIKKTIDAGMQGLFFPQNADYARTSDIVKMIASENNKSLRLTKVFNWMISLSPFAITKKAFGNLTYEKVDLVDRYGFEESMKLTEG